MLFKYPIFRKESLLIATVILLCNIIVVNTALAGVIYLPIRRTNAKQPITKLEVVALVKSKIKGRILSVKKRSKYKYPDCFHVKMLEHNGEYQLIKVGCSKKTTRK